MIGANGETFTEQGMGRTIASLTEEGTLDTFFGIVDRFVVTPQDRLELERARAAQDAARMELQAQEAGNRQLMVLAALAAAAVAAWALVAGLRG